MAHGIDMERWENGETPKIILNTRTLVRLYSYVLVPICFKKLPIKVML